MALQRWTRAAFGLVGRFAIVSFVLIALLGVASGIVLQRSVRERAVTDAIRTGEVAASIGVRPLLRTEDFQRDFVPLERERVSQLDAALANAMSDRGFVRIKVWNRQHWLIYSDNPSLLGRWFPSTELLDASFDGRIASEITDLTAPEEREERDFGRLLAVYVPLFADGDGGLSTDGPGEVVGAFEIYLPYAPIAAAIESDTRQLYLTLGAGLLALYLALYRIVAGASRRLRRQAAENLHQATHDPLTGLVNRARFEHLVSEQLGAVGELAVVVIDLDDFKLVNDTLGHDVGDQLLVEISRRLAEAVDDDGVVARLGGDEFALCLPGIGAGTAVAEATALLAVLDAPMTAAGVELHATASCGVALAPDHGTTVTVLLQHADIAMYVAKRAHGRIELYADEHNPHRTEDLELASQVRVAIEQRQLVLHYQPKLDLRLGRITGVEALVRWQHPERGLLGPGHFLPVIEQTDLIREVTNHLLGEALAQCRRWHEAGLNLTVAVNLSARNALDLQLPATIETLLRQTGVPASFLECELTESAVLRHPERARQVLDQIDRMGVKLSIDDFGTGYASLATLTGLPIRTLKIDQSFVKELLEGGQGAAIVTFSIALAQELGLGIVAEGVEDPATLERLRVMGCHIAQGYHIAKPLPADDLGALVRTLDPRSLLPSGARS